MSFNTALSGLRAANQDLSVTGNNIANASTTGFKRSRTEFGDVYANQLVGGGSSPGSGVLVTDIAQQFTQGNISFTDNSLDLAVNGQGFFIMSDGGARTYTRAGNFGLDNSGFITSNNGAKLQGFPADAQGVITTGVLSDLQIQTTALSPQLTQNADIEFNLDSRLSAPAVAAFDPLDPDSFNSSTSVTVFDSMGNPHVMSQYFIKQPAPAVNAWDMVTRIDGNMIGGAPGASPATELSTTVTFNTDGSLNSPSSVAIPNWTPLDNTGNPSGAIGPVPIPPSTTSSGFTVNIGTSTQFGGEFSVTSVGQDGFAPGRLAGVQVSDTGVIFARYTNGESLNLGQLAMAAFDNSQGLTPLGDTAWAESFESGQPIVGDPQSGSLGAVQSGALEESNVDLSEELVRLIIAQRNFQANTKTIETANTVTQAIINLR
jgi:flagellar hook protein FlgE